MKIGVPDNNVEQFLTPKIAVFGVGGAGTNAVNNMITEKLAGVDFIVANTDAQDLNTALTEQKIQLGIKRTLGLGAGAKPEVGRESAIESEDKIREALEGFHMLFVTAGMGGGTGTGAAPIVAQIAKDMGILTVAFATKPFTFEGSKRMRTAEAGILELAQSVDSLIVIPNQKLFCVAEKGMKFTESFKRVDTVLYHGVKSITNLILSPGLINLDFSDVRTTMENSGMAMMGTGFGTTEDRAIAAVECAMLNPLLDCSSMKGASKILVNIQGNVELDEVDEIMNRIQQEASEDAEIILGSSLNNEDEEDIVVSIVATGLKQSDADVSMPRKVEKQPEEAFDDLQPINIQIPVQAAPISEMAISVPEPQIPMMEQVNDNQKQSEAIPSMPNAQSFFNTIGGGVGVKNEEFSPKIVNIGREIKPPVIFVPASEEINEKDEVELINDDFFDNGSNQNQDSKKVRTSLFERVTGITRGDKIEEKPQMAAVANGFAVTPEDRSVSSSFDDGFEIPTFLRR